VRVVDADEHGSVTGEVGEEPEERVPGRVGGLERIESRLRPARKPEHRPGTGRRTLQQPAPPRSCDGQQRRLEELAHDAVAEALLQRTAASGEQRQPALGREPHGELQQRRLADAGLAFDEHEPPPARTRLAQRAPEQRALVGALQQLLAQQARLLTRC
jgi:hypothetical protein